MGQRLIIENYIDGNLVNNIYYHWSAYTNDAFVEVINIRDFVASHFDQYDQYDESLSLIDNFNLACLSAVSGVADDCTKSRFYISALLGETYHCDNLHRDRGFIAYHPDERCNMTAYGEGTIPIYWKTTDDNELDFQTSSFDFDEISWYISIDELKDDEYERTYISSMIDDIIGFENTDLSFEDKIKFIKEHHSITHRLRIDHAEDFLKTLPNVWYDTNLNGIRYKIM